MVRAHYVLNEYNSHLPFYHYSTCPDRGCLALHCGVYVPTTRFPEEKFTELFHHLLEEAMDTYPLIINFIRNRETFNDLQEILTRKQSHLEAEITNRTEGEENGK